MNMDPVYAPMDPALKPTRRMLMQLIAQRSGGHLVQRAEMLQLRGMHRGWSAAQIEQLLGRVLEHADAMPDSFGTEIPPRRSRARNKHHLAQVKGCDQPVISARATFPKTPASREQVCSVAAVGRNADDLSACATVKQPREVIV